MDGVIATNTTLARDAVQGLAHAEEAGGLSGAPVFEASNRVIAQLRAALGAGYPIIGVGGVLSGADARAKLAAGADLVQVYTALVYEGPRLVTELRRAARGAAGVADDGGPRRVAALAALEDLQDLDARQRGLQATALEFVGAVGHGLREVRWPG